jgi:hypothetical protein
VKNINRQMTLEMLEDKIWGEPEFKSHLSIECHRLRKIPLENFSIENLRMMIGQKFSLEYLVPIALEKLVANPYVAGKLYSGDLLSAVLKVNSEFWDEHQDLLFELADVIGIVEELVTFNSQEVFPLWENIAPTK